MHQARILQATMRDRMTLSRQVVQQGRPIWETVYRDRACALSRSAAFSTGPVPTAVDEMAEAHYLLRLFLPAGTVVRAGDRIEVHTEQLLLRGTGSQSFGYPSYSVCTLQVEEVVGL